MFGNRKQSFFVGNTLVKIFVVASFFLMGIFSTHAALKDSDVDGLTDGAEVNTYHTDLNAYDTDGDGFDDGYEVVNATDPLDGNSTPFATEMQTDSETQSFLTNKRIFEAFGASVLLVGCFFLVRSFVSKNTITID